MKWIELNPRIKRVSLGRGIVRMLPAFIVVVQLVACGGGGGSSSASGTDDVGTSSSAETVFPSGGGQTGTGGSGSLTLSWVAPAARADGTTLSLADIDGFRIYYGKSAGKYTHSVNIPDSTTQQVVLKHLARGTYYLVMTTYDVDGRESGHSDVVRKTVS